ncbi:PLP-dependent aminotransferase family protein [Bradyrhizobium sp. STM 3562]|uniref:aminotransferase-like domain-containing protein n=1 Tax=Bradyrhizobium sp. STM 3562 TaxID=578924 RepID=UPI00388EBF7B
MSQQISMMRAAAPKLEIFANALRATWRELAASEESMAAQFQTHRFTGTDDDRTAAVSWIGDRIVPTPAIDRVMLTNGTMNSILLLSSSLVGPGNVILAEELTFPIVYTLTEIAGAAVQGVEIDDLGIRPDDFEKKCQQFKPKAVYLNCTVHSPTAYVTPTERRVQIAEIARRYGVHILEDEAQALYLENAPKSFATIAPDITWYMMGLSKYLSLGVRVAYVVAPSANALNSVLEKFRPLTTWHPAPILANIVTRWIEIGTAQKLLAAVRGEVHRRQLVAQELLKHLVGFRSSHGIHFWLEAPPGVASTEFSKAIGEAGVIVRPSQLYSGAKEPRLQGVRPGVGEPSSIEEMRRAVDLMREVYERLHRPKRSAA